jgi:type VI protein secretion system component VasK
MTSTAEAKLDALTISWRELLFVLVVVLAVYVAEMLLLLRMRRSKSRNREEDAHPSAPGMEAMRRELADMQHQLAQVCGELEQMKKKGEFSATPYSQAIQLARQGREAAEVASSCGISRGEAELIVALYRDS